MKSTNNCRLEMLLKISFLKTFQDFFSMSAKISLLLDTNFLLAPVQFKVNIYDELSDYQLLTLEKCINELEKIADGKSRDAPSAKIAMDLIMEKGIKIIATKEKITDSAILSYAKKHGCAVATNDRKLIKTLKSNKIKIIRLRQRKFLTGI
jgi:rRNA-processing protein FCF1